MRSTNDSMIASLRLKKCHWPTFAGDQPGFLQGRQMGRYG